MSKILSFLQANEFMIGSLLALRHGNPFKSIASNNWSLSFEVSLTAFFISLFYFSIKLLLFIVQEKRNSAQKITIFSSNYSGLRK